MIEIEIEIGGKMLLTGRLNWWTLSVLLSAI